jgi:tetratricopeptide (TPR) repeat protein
VKDERLHSALLDSLKLSGSGQHEEAVRLMDELIAEATKEGDGLTALLLINHAAILNGGERDRSLAKRYYEQFLTYNPENPRVLYESADVAMEDGQIEIAKEHAKRCHQAILKSDDDKIKKDLLDLILERWPELAE